MDKTAELSTQITHEEVAQLRAFMETRYGKGSPDPHTASKARTYLGQIEKQGLCDKKLAIKTAQFVDGCRGVSSGRLQWKDLADRMREWF